MFSIARRGFAHGAFSLVRSTHCFEVGEREVRFLLLKHVCVNPECERGIGVPELVGHPANTLTGTQRERGPRVARVVEA